MLSFRKYFQPDHCGGGSRHGPGAQPRRGAAAASTPVSHAAPPLLYSHKEAAPTTPHTAPPPPPPPWSSPLTEPTAPTDVSAQPASVCCHRWWSDVMANTWSAPAALADRTVPAGDRFCQCEPPKAGLFSHSEASLSTP